MVPSAVMFTDVFLLNLHLQFLCNQSQNDEHRPTKKSAENCTEELGWDGEDFVVVAVVKDAMNEGKQ